MATPYNHKAIEQKWRKHWQEHPVNVNDGKKPKYYCLDMFPYPSGSGLHVGHWRGYVISDVWSRYKLLNGYYVIHPMGWDAFGLPAENYAIKMGTHPRISTEANIKNIKRQINEISAIYDWDMEVNTTDPEFYKWTQWIFVKMFKKGLAYEKQMPINWCPSCKTGLANEEVVNGKCERCGADVTKKNLRQWMLKITAYADRLLADLDKLDWPEKVKKMQAEWIGKSHGAEVNFKVDGRDDEITVYTTRDVWSRYKLLNGYYVIHPMGWDAFGLPAENYAIKMGTHPRISTEANIKNIKRQINEISAIYDWDMEVNTTDPEFYKWTQWIFVKMFKKGLAYEKQMPINWCPSCKTGLANEEVVNGKCERCGADVTKKNLRQWMLKITAYADRLLADLDKLDWPEKVKKMQAEWIGKSHGAEVNFKVDGRDDEITVYTTRPDTLHGATFMVLAPEHELAKELATDETREAVEEYIYQASLKSSVDRMQDKEKTGVFTGSYAINPINGAKVPIWLSDYVLADYGTGAIMCVPAHDDRDFEFAKKFNIPIIQVIAKDGKEIENMEEAYTEASGIMINSGDWNGKESSELKEEAPKIIEEMGIGKKTTNYKLRDWVFSRQRYWGEPIPIVHCPDCGAVPVPEEELPLTLPEVEKYEPTGTGESPLADIEEWVNCKCPVCGKDAKRETNTMPQWAGSSWYFLRYIDNKNNEELVSREKADKYLPVDMYIGGVEHAVLHLLYSRFYTKFLCDIGVIDFDEPFHKLFNQGMITGKNGIKMSKSKGNVVSPDDLVRDYGCDSLRMYELFVGPPELDAEWDESGIDGVHRFLTRFYKLVMDQKDKGVKADKELLKVRHKLIYDITTRLNNFSLNTVVSGFMEYTNTLTAMAKKDGVDKETLEDAVVLLAPFAPHIAEELWEAMGHGDSVFAETWPTYDEEAMKEDEVEIVVQINGKVKGKLVIAAEEDKDSVLAKAKEVLGDKLNGNIVKEIYVPGRIVNIVQK